MPHVYRLNLFNSEDREELMLAEFEEGVAFTFIYLLEVEYVFVKRERLFDIVHFDRDMITTVNLNAHFLNRSSALIISPLRLRNSFQCAAASSSINFSPLAASATWRWRRSVSPGARVTSFFSTKRSTMLTAE